MRLLYDALATFDVVGGYLLLVIRFQTIYVAVFRALHGSEPGLGVAPPGSPRRRRPKRPDNAFRA